MSSARPQSARRTSQANIWAAKPTQPTQRITPRHCKPYILLHREIRPSTASQTKYNVRRTDICTSSCIYCDIWKLGLLVLSRAPTHADEQPHNSTPSTPRATASSEHEYQIQLKAFDSAYFSERMRFKSILSICTAQGASESEGLRAAHDRCLATVLDLLRRERALEKRMVVVRESECERERERERELELAFRDWSFQQQSLSPVSPVYQSRRGSRQWEIGRWDSISGTVKSFRICAA